jgi:hypothetical protein
MGFSNNALQIETVTPERAQEFLRCNFAGQRRFRQNWADYLANEMREGRFLPTAEIHIMYRNGEPVMVNGQHTCMAIIKYGKPVRVTVRKTSTTEHGQIAMMYALGHDTGLKRTMSDSLSAYGLLNQYDIGSSRQDQLTTAMRHIRAGFNEDGRSLGRLSAPPPTEVVDHVEEWVHAAKLFWGTAIAKGGNRETKRLLDKRGALSVVITTYRYQPLRASEFWEKVVAPDSIMTSDPRAITARVLDKSRNTPYGSDKMTSATLSRALARCWKAFIEGEEMKQTPKNIKDGDKIAIWGTPFTGRHPNPPWWPE